MNLWNINSAISASVDIFADNAIIKKDSIKITQLQSSHKKYKVVTKISIIVNIILACLLVK